MFKHYDDDDLKKKCKFNYIITIKKMKIRRPYCYLRVCFKKGGVNLKILMENVHNFDSLPHMHSPQIKMTLMTFLTLYKGLFEKFSWYLPLYCASTCPT